MHSTDQKQRVLLLNPPFNYRILRDYYCCTCSKTGYLWQPIDLLIQSGILGQKHVVSVCDAMGQGMTRNAAIKSAIDFRPTAIFSLIGSLSLDSDLNFLQDLKARTKTKIIVSGDAVLHRPDMFLKTHPWIHAALFNFTTDDISKLLNDETFGITSAAYRIGDDVEIRRNMKPNEFQYPTPLHSAFADKAYNMPYAPAGFASVLTSFGCPFSCSYCNSGVHSIGFSFRNIENVIEELHFLYSQNTRHIFFKDMTFGLDIGRTRRLCGFMINNAQNMTWHAYTRLDLIDEERIDLYARSGCRLLQIGLETADAEIGRRAGKNTDPARIKKAFKLLKSKGIAAGAHFILGLPSARIRNDVNTISMAMSLHLGYASFNIFTPRPGSQFFETRSPGKRTRFTLKLLLRTAYFIFYLHPRRLVSLFSKGKSQYTHKSLFIFLKYLLFLPDIKAHRATNPQPRSIN